jgi:hypothetical protein
VPLALSRGFAPTTSVPVLAIKGVRLMPTLEEWVVVLLLIVVLISTAMVGLMS